MTLFSFKNFSELALTKTNNTGVESALEWLFANKDAIENATVDTSTPSSEAPTNEPSEGGEKTSEENAGEAKSFKCEDWYDILPFVYLVFDIHT